MTAVTCFINTIKNYRYLDFRYISKTEISAGLIPDILEA